MVQSDKDRLPLPEDGPLPGEPPEDGPLPGELPEDGPLPGELLQDVAPTPVPPTPMAPTPVAPTPVAPVTASPPALAPLAPRPFNHEPAFGDPTESERIRATDRFVFELPELPANLSWRLVRETLIGTDTATRWKRGSIAAVGLVLLGLWSYSQRLKRWPLETLTGHTKSVFALASTARRSLVATGGDDHTIRICSFETGELIRQIEVDKNATGDGVLALGFSPKGDLLVAATGGGTQLWAVESGQLVKTLDPWERGALTAAYSPKGDFMASSRRGDDTIRLYSAPDGNVVSTLRGHKGGVFTLGFSPSGDQLVSGGADGTVKIWSLTSFTEVRRMPHPGNVLAAAFSPAGDVVASTGDDHVLRLWGAFDGSAAAPDLPTSGSVRSLAFSATSERLFFGDDDEVVRAITPRTGAIVFSRRQTSKPLAVALSPDGDRLAVGLSSGEVPIWWAPASMK